MQKRSNLHSLEHSAQADVLLSGKRLLSVAIHAIGELADSATWEDIEERVRFLSAIDKGLADVRAGKVVAHEEVKESLKKWLAV